jgi:AcrR family transcriptional regulator
MPAAVEQRIDRRRARTREALLRAGVSLFAIRPVDAVSIDEIVEAADVAKGSFYNHFPDKDSLAREIAEQVRRGVEDLVANVNRDVADPAERVARALCAFARQTIDHPQRLRAGLRLFPAGSVPDAPMNRGVRADIQAGLAAGRFDGVTLEVGVLMAVGVLQIAVARALERDGSAPVVSRGLAFGLLRGLGLPSDEARAIAAKASADLFAQRD